MRTMLFSILFLAGACLMTSCGSLGGIKDNTAETVENTKGGDGSSGTPTGGSGPENRGGDGGVPEGRRKP